MSKQAQRVVSKFSLYLMANPDATRQDFMLDTGGKIKDWYNSRDRVAGDTLRDRGVRLPHSKSIIYLMMNPKATKEQYSKAGFNPDTYMHNCIRARDLLVACSAANTYVSSLNATIKMAKSEKVAPKPVVKPAVQPVGKPEPPVKPPARLLQIKDQCVDHSDLIIKINSAVNDLVGELTEQQTEINTYRARITALNAENFRLRAEISELTEMINGPTK